MIDHNHKLIFMHIARTGGTSVESALVGRDWWLIDPQSKHLSSSQTRDYFGIEFWERYSTFTIVRNPWDRVVSMFKTGWWHHPSGVPPDATFEQFCLSLKSHPNERYEALKFGDIIDIEPNYILRFENLFEDLNDMLLTLGVPPVAVSPHLEHRPGSPYQYYYNEVSRRCVAEFFSDEIRRFGYSF